MIEKRLVVARGYGGYGGGGKESTAKGIKEFWGEMITFQGFPGGSGDAEDAGSIPGSGRSPGGGNGNPLQYPCLENPMDRGAWQDIVHEAAESWTRLSD